MIVEQKYSYTKDGVEHEYHVVVDDSTDMNPRTEWDNAGVMVCFHRRYTLGDTNHGYDSENYNGFNSLEEDIREKEDPLVILPIYMIDHSGLSVSTSSFNDPWDSGQIGFIFISKKKASEEWSNLKGRELYDMAVKCLEGEVEVYAHYLRGNVHGFIDYVKTTCDQGCEHLEEENSCWGFFGDIDECGVLDELPADATQIL